MSNNIWRTTIGTHTTTYYEATCCGCGYKYCQYGYPVSRACNYCNTWVGNVPTSNISSGIVFIQHGNGLVSLIKPARSKKKRSRLLNLI